MAILGIAKKRLNVDATPHSQNIKINVEIQKNIIIIETNGDIH